LPPAGIAQARELRPVPAERLVRFAFDPAEIAAERDAMLGAERHRPDRAATRGVGRHIELIERRRLDIARGIY
jgi:hypothetical protein